MTISKMYGTAVKKRLLFITITIVGLILLAAQAGNSNSATAMTYSSSQTVAEAIKNDDVQIEVLHARICRDTHHQEEGCCIQEVLGRIVSAHGRQCCQNLWGTGVA